MAGDYFSGNVQATLSISATKKTATVNGGTATGTGTLLTVGAGKKWTILHLSISNRTATAADNDIYLTLNGVRFIGARVQALASTIGIDSTTATFDYQAAPVLNATETVGINVGGGAADWSIAYVEETA